MKKASNKSTDREVRYVAFKSYHLKPPATKINKPPEPKSGADQDKKKSKKTRPKGSSASVPRSAADKHNGDGVGRSAAPEPESDEIGRIRKLEVELAYALKDLESENESLKRSLSASIPLESHERIKTLLEESRGERDQLQRLHDELRRLHDDLEQRNGELSERIRGLERQLEEANGENAELADRVELGIDQINYLSQANDAKTSRLKELEGRAVGLETEVARLTTANAELAGRNEELARVVDELRGRVEEQNRKLENHYVLKRKLKSREHEVQKANEERAVKAKFVELLETDNLQLTRSKELLTEQNNRLSKELAEMKKRMELLRQKFDGVNKENKGIKEKEARCLIHEGINVGKYVKIPSIVTNRDESRDAGCGGPSQSRFLNYATTHKRAKTTNSFNERLYNLLHRREGQDEHSNAKSKTR